MEKLFAGLAAILLAGCASRPLDNRELIDSMIADRDAVTARELYVDFYANASNMVFRANADSWAVPLDLSCLSVWNTSAEPHSHGGTLISPWHVLFSRHWYLGKGKSLYFRDRSGKVHKRDVADARHVKGTDLTVAALTEALDEIEPVRVLPTNAVSRIRKGEPVIVINQDKYATIADLDGFDEKANPLKAAKFSFGPSCDPVRRSFFVLVRNFDSGSPTFMHDGKGPILLGLHREVGEDANVTAFIADIQKLMDELHPGCTLRH